MPKKVRQNVQEYIYIYICFHELTRRAFLVLIVLIIYNMVTLEILRMKKPAPAITFF